MGGGGGQCRHNDEFPKRPFLNSPPIWKYLVFKKKKKNLHHEEWIVCENWVHLTSLIVGLCSKHNYV